MHVRNNYNECITNLACSIRKYFNLDYKHNTLSYVDDILCKMNPKNVVVILYDGMGSKILKRYFSSNDFFLKNMYKEITTVFPATTTAATTSMVTGLNPIEHGFLGYDMYIKPIDETVSLFMNTNKLTGELSDMFVNIKDKYLITKTIIDEINERGDDYGLVLYPFGDNPYSDLDDMFERIKSETKKEGRRYIYAYNVQPDSLMHKLSADNKDVISLINERQVKTEKLCEQLNDTLVIVIADHGHIKIDNVYLKDYPELLNMLERTTSLEPRAVSFKVKEGMDLLFKDLFIKTFGDDFYLYDKEDVVNSKLFGDGDENLLFNDALGDFIAIAHGNKALLDEGDVALFSHHAGYTDDEIYIPLIIKYCK